LRVKPAMTKKGQARSDKSIKNTFEVVLTNGTHRLQIGASEKTYNS